MVSEGKVGQIHKIMIRKGGKFCKVVFDVFLKGSRASLTVRILRYEIEKGLRAIYPNGKFQKCIPY